MSVKTNNNERGSSFFAHYLLSCKPHTVSIMGSQGNIHFPAGSAGENVGAGSRVCSNPSYVCTFLIVVLTTEYDSGGDWVNQRPTLQYLMQSERHIPSFLIPLLQHVCFSVKPQVILHLFTLSLHFRVRGLDVKYKQNTAPHSFN